MDRRVRLEIILNFIKWLACYLLVTVFSKASLTISKTPYLPHFLFWRLSVFIEAKNSYISYHNSFYFLAVYAVVFVVSSTKLGCVFGDLYFFVMWVETVSFLTKKYLISTVQYFVQFLKFSLF